MLGIKQIYNDLGNAMKDVCDKLYSRSRPKSVDVKVDSYIVVDAPYSIRNNEMNDDGSFNDYTTTVQIRIYVRDKAAARNPNKFNLDVMDEKVKAVLGKFPIATENIIVTKPRVAIQGDDGDGFSVVIVQGRLRTR